MALINELFKIPMPTNLIVTGNAETHLNFLSRLPAVPCREDLAKVAQDYFYKTGKAVEVGVYQGHFMENALKSWSGKYYAVDAWAFRDDNSKDRNFKDDATNDENFSLTLERAKPHGDRVELIRMLSVNASEKFEDDTIDWVYIDALHTYDACLADMHAWWKKLRPGGLMSGDDFGNAENFELLDDNRRKDLTHLHQTAKGSNWGVVKATHDFAREHGVILHTSYLVGNKGNGLKASSEGRCYQYPCWYIVKPYAA